MDRNIVAPSAGPRPGFLFARRVSTRTAASLRRERSIGTLARVMQSRAHRKSAARRKA
jgi:hypothetical protein